MSESNQHSLEELAQQYPADHCRKIASFVLDMADAPDDDRVRAAGILNALDAADHVSDLTVVEVGKWQLLASAAADADLLWSKYDEDGEYTPSRRDPEEPPDSGTQNGIKLRSVLDSSAEILRKASSLPRSRN